MPSHRHGLARRSAGRSLLAVGAALLLTSGCLGWGQRGYDAGKGSYNPTERTLTAANVSGLTPLWSDASPTVAAVSSGDLVHVMRVGATGVEVATHDAGTGALVWGRRVERYLRDDTAHLAVVDGKVVVTAAVQQEATGLPLPPIYLASVAFDVSTGANATNPYDVSAYPSNSSAVGTAAYGATVALVPLEGEGGTRIVYKGSPPNADALGGYDPLLDEGAGMAYVGVGLGGAESRVYAYNLSCAELWCDALWTHPGDTRQAVLEPGARTLYIATTQLEALDAATGTVNWTAPVASDVRPAVRDQTVFAVDDGRLVAVPACGAFDCSAAWSAALPSGIDVRYLQPAGAGDVVYVAAGDATTTTVSAFDAEGCGTAICAPLATVTAPGQAVDLLVAGGRLVVATNSGVYAFGLPA